MRARWLAVAALLTATLPDEGLFGWLHPLARVPLVLAALLAWWRPQHATRAEVLGVVMVLLNWALLRLLGLHPSRSDDSLYFYMALRVSEGAVPYRDFFFAHPPLQLVLPTVVFKCAGFSLPVAKALPAVTQTFAALSLYFAVRPCSRVWALLTLALHLNVYRVLMGATDLTGTNLVCALLAASLWAAMRDRAGLAGVLAGLSLGAGLYAAPGVVALLWLLRARSVRAVAGVCCGIAAWGLPSMAWGGAAFFDGVFGYHFSRLPGVSASSGHAWFDLFVSGPVYSCAALLALVWRGARAMRRDAAILPEAQLTAAAALAVVLFAGFFVGVGRVHGYYLLPLLLFASLLAGWSLWQASTFPPHAWLGVLLLWLLLVQPLARRAASKGGYTSAGAAPVRPHAPELLRALYLSGDRAAGELEPGWRRYARNKSRTVDTAEAMAEFVRARTGPQETIAGASTLAPLVALLADRRLAADEADTNAQRFMTGSLGEAAFFQRSCGARVRYLVAAPDSYFTEERLEAAPVVQRFFVREREFLETALRADRAERYVFYRLRDGERCVAP